MPAWEKWTPRSPTSPHWYTIDRLSSLIAAYLTRERAGDRPRTVREFVSEFAGLSGTAKQKAVTESAGLSGAYLHDLAANGDISRAQVAILLGAMQQEAKIIKPSTLGTLGEKHLVQHLITHHYVAPSSVHYKKAEGLSDGLPFVLEVAFGVHTGQFETAYGERIIGLNWTPTLSRGALPELASLLGEQRVDIFDPVELVVHLACPRLDYTDHGKTRLALSPAISNALSSAVKEVTKGWKRVKRQADQDDRVRARELDDLRKSQHKEALSFTDAAKQVMEQAYLKASAGGRFPANARQIMYAARPLVMELTGGEFWKNSASFTQEALPDYLAANPEHTASWDVVFDDRGHFAEPHTGRQLGIGTLAVRRYIQSWQTSVSPRVDALTVPIVLIRLDQPTAMPMRCLLRKRALTRSSTPRVLLSGTISP